MAYINIRNKEIQLKIVYYGPGQGGKTTNLLYINKNFSEKIKSQMVSIDTYGDRTIFFDFFPFDLGQINGFDIKIQLYTVPGQSRYDTTRKLVLNGVDGIVFVADMLASMRRKNILSLNNLYENLMTYNKNIFKIPLVFQFNKVDLSQKGYPLLPKERLVNDLNRQLKRPYIIASALTGENVAVTLKRIISMTTANLKTNLN
ncbi:MAG: GTPase domain-containing protein [Desulfobacterales bacterium]|jgi:small GTP-binding protein|nr:GTPase domain-containing protein [Desulfobacterales bacterium]